ncbi:MAG: hypothetical protein WC617_01305 [Rhodanobacter sp.]|jgi:dipeptidyl aminopeptidase/acylaminoacyl peptidase
MLLMQSTGDKVVWQRNASSLAAALRREGEPVELKLLSSGHRPCRDPAGHVASLPRQGTGT